MQEQVILEDPSVLTFGLDFGDADQNSIDLSSDCIEISAELSWPKVKDRPDEIQLSTRNGRLLLTKETYLDAPYKLQIPEEWAVQMPGDAFKDLSVRIHITERAETTILATTEQVRIKFDYQQENLNWAIELLDGNMDPVDATEAVLAFSIVHPTKKLALPSIRNGRLTETDTNLSLGKTTVNLALDEAARIPWRLWKDLKLKADIFEDNTWRKSRYDRVPKLLLGTHRCLFTVGLRVKPGNTPYPWPDDPGYPTFIQQGTILTKTESPAKLLLDALIPLRLNVNITEEAV